MRTIVVDLNRESKIAHHPPNLRGRGARCGEIAVDEDGIRRIERQWLQAAKVVFASAGNADLGARMKEAEEA